MKKFIKKVFQKKASKPWSIPDNVRVYCVGDIHGQDNLLEEIHHKIMSDSNDYSGKKIVVYLGDYIDRGLQSKEVVDRLLNEPLKDFQSIHLRGNHEQVLLDFLNDDANIALDWFNFGGKATIASYGVPMAGIPFGDKLIQLQKDLADRIPTMHLFFYSQLQCCYELGDYFFVHAGIKPKVSLDKQTDLVMMWIRDEFLNSKRSYEKMIVHGHSVSNEPVVLPNRIGIDTGAYATGNLTCLVLEGEEKRFFSTATEN